MVHQDAIDNDHPDTVWKVALRDKEYAKAISALQYTHFLPMKDAMDTAEAYLNQYKNQHKD